MSRLSLEIWASPGGFDPATNWIGERKMQAASNDLNIQCLCTSLDRKKLLAALQAESGPDLFAKHFTKFHEASISDVPVFVDRRHMQAMRDIIEAVEKIAKTEPYEEAALQNAPAIAAFRPGALGVLMGYDFHLTPEGPKLIEINTNAGGALINAYLARAQRLCCATIEGDEESGRAADDPVDAILTSFWEDWRRQRGAGRPRSIAIIDEDPQHQYFYLEMLLFKTLFARHGVDAIIASPDQLAHRDGELRCGKTPVDMVYNRLTDFYFEETYSSALKSAYLADDVVVTPNPRAHAILANKRNMSLLGDESRLREWNVDEKEIRVLANGIPATISVEPDRADEFWAERKKYFFKPVAGYGGKAAYRGDKLTRRVWSEILEHKYVAQAIVPPSVRNVLVDGLVETMKVDIRNYTYDGSILLTAARLYQGQTTNMRTPGGGFSPAYSVNLDELQDCSCG